MLKGLVRLGNLDTLGKNDHLMRVDTLYLIGLRGHLFARSRTTVVHVACVIRAHPAIADVLLLLFLNSQRHVFDGRRVRLCRVLYLFRLVRARRVGFCLVVDLFLELDGVSVGLI